MNKYKKIAMAVISTVMAGAMLVPLSACGNNKKLIKPTGSNQAELTPTLDANGKLDWGNDVNLNVSVGHNDMKLGAAYNGTGDNNNIGNLNSFFGVSSGAPLYGGEYVAGNFKPAWQALADELGVTFTNKYTGESSDGQMTAIKATQEGLAGVDLFTSSASDLNKEATGDSEAILDITKYLKYMPNYSAFLDQNPTTRLSLTAGKDGAMYMLPYFDGNDDIEKYVLLRKDIVEDLLNATGDITGAISYKKSLEDKTTYGTGTATASHVESFMGKTGSWKIAVTDPSALDATADPDKDWGNDAYKTKEGQATKTIEITVSYADALTNAKSTAEGDMGAILKAAGVADADIAAQASGNIIDIMNLAINKTEGAVTGDTLTKLLRKYIAVAYKYNNASFYTGDRKLADVFNSAYAAWDADLYTALGRCFTTSGTYLGNKVMSSEKLFLLTGRQTRTDRFNDTVALAGELYGVRGMGNLYQYTYFDSKGNLLDARTKVDMFNALDKMNKLTQEGLYAPLISTTTITNGEVSHSDTEKNKGIQSLSLRDYVQTQTANRGFRAETAGEAVDDYNFAPVLTPVSNWDTNADGKADKIMRFTESWRTVKTTGFGISYKAMQNNPDKLAATLALVDYMFSNDGQILMTYGPMSANGNDDGTVQAAKTKGNGFWYATEITNVDIATVAEKYQGSDQYHVKEANKVQYFVYKNKLYTGTFYNGRQIPTMTASNLMMFHDLGKNNFTNYARYYIGTTLPIGNKDQGFEYQCTAKCGLRGSDIVALALVNGTIEHVVQQIPGLSNNKLGNWYSVVPTVLFYDSDIQNMLTAGTDTVKYYLVTGMGGSKQTHLFVNGSGSVGNFAHDIMAYGLGSNHAISLLASSDASAKLPADAADCIDYLNTHGMDVFAEEMNASWKTLQKVYVG